MTVKGKSPFYLEAQPYIKTKLNHKSMTEQEIKNIILAKQAKRADERDPETIRKRALDMAQLYAEGKTYSEIGEKYNLTRQRVHMIVKAFLKK